MESKSQYTPSLENDFSKVHYEGEQRIIFGQIVRLISEKIPVSVDMMHQYFDTAVKEWQFENSLLFCEMRLVEPERRICVVKEVFSNLNDILIDVLANIHPNICIDLCLDKILEYYIQNYADRDFFH